MECLVTDEYCDYQVETSQVEVEHNEELSWRHT